MGIWRTRRIVIMSDIVIQMQTLSCHEMHRVQPDKSKSCRQLIRVTMPPLKVSAEK